MKIITKNAKMVTCVYGCQYPIGLYSILLKGGVCWPLCAEHVGHFPDSTQIVDLTRRGGPGWKPRPIQSRRMTPEIAKRLLTLVVHFGLQGHAAARIEDVNHGRAYEVINGDRYPGTEPYPRDQCSYDPMTRTLITW